MAGAGQCERVAGVGKVWPELSCLRKVTWLECAKFEKLIVLKAPARTSESKVSQFTECGCRLLAAGCQAHNVLGVDLFNYVDLGALFNDMQLIIKAQVCEHRFTLRIRPAVTAAATPTATLHSSHPHSPAETIT